MISREDVIPHICRNVFVLYTLVYGRFNFIWLHFITESVSWIYLEVVCKWFLWSILFLKKGKGKKQHFYFWWTSRPVNVKGYELWSPVQFRVPVYKISYRENIKDFCGSHLNSKWLSRLMQLSYCFSRKQVHFRLKCGWFQSQGGNCWDIIAHGPTGTWDLFIRLLLLWV